MKAVVVYESMFGNTEEIARKIAAGLSESCDTSLCEVIDNPVIHAGEYDVIVLGAPTHALTMSTPKSRTEATNKGAKADVIPEGIREWLPTFPANPAASVIATFDTRLTKARHLPGSAAKALARRVKKVDGVAHVQSTSFYVSGGSGPIDEGEQDRAFAWGRSLAKGALDLGPGPGEAKD